MPFNPGLRIAAAAFFTAAIGAANASARAAEYPKITLGSLDGRPGVAVVELNPSMSLAYDAAGLWMAWQGIARAAGPAQGSLPAGPEVSGGDAGPRQEATGARASARLIHDGPIFHTRRVEEPWEARKDAKPFPVTATLRGAGLEDGLPKITYVLRIGSDSARVEEYPQFDDHYGAKALFRYFVFTGMPRGATLRVDLRGRPPREGEKPKFTEVGLDSLVQTGNGKTRVKISWPELAWGAGW